MEAYIVNGYRTAVTRARKGGFKNTRPDDLAIDTIKYLVQNTEGLEASMVDDLIVGNAVQEAEQGSQGEDSDGYVQNVFSLRHTEPAKCSQNRRCSEQDQRGGHPESRRLPREAVPGGAPVLDGPPDPR